MGPGIRARGRFERASFIRHVAICAAAAVAYALRDHLRVGNEALWILGSTVVVNVLFTLVPDRPGWTRFSLLLSPFFGLAGWAVLVLVTGGAASPFVAGFGLEILLSASACSPWLTRGVTAGAIAALWLQQGALGVGPALRPLSFQSAFLIAMGSVTVILTRQWMRARDESGRAHAALMARLSALEDEMGALRRVGEAGAHVALLAHAYKNAVHSLRGFAALLDGEVGPRAAEALDGLRAAIDRLEEIARLTLGRGPGDDLLSGAATRRVIEEAIAEVARTHPAIRWRRRVDADLPAIHADRGMLREALVNLLRNGAEAMDGAGEVAIDASAAAGRFEIRVRDHGRGIGEGDARHVFEPGFTTKRGGSGFGLFLARRLAEARGGRLTIGRAEGQGTVTSLDLVPEGSEGS